MGEKEREKISANDESKANVATLYDVIPGSRAKIILFYGAQYGSAVISAINEQPPSSRDGRKTERLAAAQTQHLSALMPIEMCSRRVWEFDIWRQECERRRRITKLLLCIV